MAVGGTPPNPCITSSVTPVHPLGHELGSIPVVKRMLKALSVTIRRAKDVSTVDVDVALIVTLITPASVWVALLVVMWRRANHREGWHMVTGRHLGLRGEMHVYSGCMDVGGGGAGWRPLHRIIWGVGVASNWERGVGSGRGWCRLGHNWRMARGWSGDVASFRAVVLEIGVIVVFSRIVNRFYWCMGSRGLGRGSQRVRGSGGLHHSVRIIHSSSRGRIWLHVAVRWIPRVVVHRVGVMRIAPRGSWIVRMVGVRNEGRLLPWRGRLRSRRGRSSDFQRSNIVLMDC